MSAPTAPLPLAAAEALARLERRLAEPDILRAAARYKVAADLTAQVARVMDTRDLADVEMTDLLYVQDAMREAWDILAAAGRLDLVEVAS
ncbi:hypothetical protein ACH49_28750 [Streptomyces leeuwenhoekii]|uniref:Uncharacterized protein n=1 Tax=Streptomyces leeuwenhoekii TaxID=1437453 RepID=A0ABR5HQY3_STRLW|nr:hypothetical protein [Streptomyces leeuwenhoekii]KMS67209.1 hypothetical protein ACH49_28750 [Streptomyces leeuwenhoekii]